jgi:UDP-N-acetylglucosamine--N-acetylmuramyl-(pentapeptide) pyrophosphoryl-undecaprenol N-acetylglucosamine transferase
VSSRRFALVAGGGTGGHVVPALAVARALATKRGEEAVELVGSRRGLDSSLVQGSGLPVTLLPGRGIVRRTGPVALVRNLWALGQMAVGLVLAAVLVARRRPAVVVATGGYACVSTAIAARAFAVPVVLLNVDAVPGAANKLVGRFAAATAVAFDGTPLPRAVVTGVPVREEILAAARPDEDARRAARSGLEIPENRRVVAVVGGSLGAGRINEAVIGLARLWSHRSDVAIYHVVGRRDSPWAKENAASLAKTELWYRQVDYEQRMGLFYQAADVVVCRAGANTISELAIVGVPSLVVPLSRSPGGHQAANAAVLERAQAAVVVEDRDCRPERIATELDKLLADGPLLRSMGEAAAGLGRPHALGEVVALVEAQSRDGRHSSQRSDVEGSEGAAR